VKQTRRKTIVSFLIVDLLSGSVKELSSSPADLLTNDDYKTAKMVLNRIPAGTFMMGAPTSENGRDYYEDLHQVTLTKDFYMAVFECTQAQYAAIMGGSDPSYFKGSMRPVEQVSWNTVRGGTWPSGEPDGTSFMGCLRTKTGLLFDLPTEAQWEYACRAGTTNAYNNDTDCLVGSQGGQDTNLDPLAWYNFNSSKSHREVGTKQANYWGLYDMHGNVWEWCLDYNEAGLGTNPVVNPVGALFEGSFRVIRGGSWDYFAKFCRSACRSDYTPGNTSNNLGFRVCLADF
jgi:formylglycine-generating enzyme required for sulfatase activity